MQQASGSQRFFAWFIDFTTLVPIYFLSYKVFEKLLKTYKVYPPLRSRGMFSYDRAAFEAFWYSVLFIFLTSIIVKGISYLKYNRTMGEALVRLKRRQENGEELTKSNRIRLVLATVIKIAFICLPGPLVAMFNKYVLGPMGAHGVGELLFFGSLFLLIVALFFFLISPIIAYFKKDKASWVEKFTKTRVFEA